MFVRENPLSHACCSKRQMSSLAKSTQCRPIFESRRKLQVAMSATRMRLASDVEISAAAMRVGQYEILGGLSIGA